MGAYQSSQSEWSKNKYLLMMIDSKSQIPKTDPFWDELLSYNPRVTLENHGKDVYNYSYELAKKWNTTNKNNENVSVLLQIFLESADKLPYNEEADFDSHEVDCLRPYNALFILRVFLHYVVQMHETLMLKQLTQVRASASPQEEDTTELIDVLLHIVIDLPVREKTYLLHLECMNMLLVLLSTEFYRRGCTIEVYDMIFEHKRGDELSKILLKRFTQQHKMPHPDKLYSSSGGSIILDIAADIIGYFMPHENEDAPLARTALLLLNVLINHQDDWQVNRYSLYLHSLSDGLEDICKTIFSVMDKEETSLLLYNLLERNSSFKPLMVAQNDIESWMLPMLQTIYKASDASGHHVYMSLIILLILSEDREFNKKIHTTMTKNVTWFVDRHLGEISLGGLTILVTARTVQYNLLKMRDEYLHSNCLAALSNMSSHFSNLHPYVCQRLVGLFEVLAKTYNRTKHELLPIERALRIILEVLNSCLSNQLASNPNLIYTLLYKKGIFEPFRNNPAFNDIINNLDQVLEYFTSTLEKTNDPCNDVNVVLKIIIEASAKWPSHRLQKFPELRFRYIEEDSTGEFFIPYVWKLVSQYSYVHGTIKDD
ncbi:dymeclin [Cimex lectularius]|uniref:Dymeclin n=1 Tax=Cimex lectularius TaxID=79782 RepID=A0A8I6SUW9_CIMLE|nr:dymeclin [Cimex lectularius]XP_014249482.1 dymeclin [Cimex lectularius]XP_024085906.1 dymeclin [Cimex lectularius]